MCVAIVVEESISLATLLACENANPHGAGVAWGYGDRVRYRKGLEAMDIWRMLDALPRPFLLHFRWATHGPRVPHLAHPFPLGDRALISRATEGVAEGVLIHNGVWNDYKRWVPDWVTAENWSDTAVAAYVAGNVGEEILDHVGWSTATARAAGDGRLDVTMRGRWMSHSDGNHYSNLSWLPRPRPTYQEWRDARQPRQPRQPRQTLACRDDQPSLWDVLRDDAAPALRFLAESQGRKGR